MKHIFIFLFLAVNLVTNSSIANDTTTLTISGSSTVHPIIRGVAKRFTAKTGIHLDSIGGGSRVGVNSASNGDADIGMASRPLTNEEKKSLNDGEQLQVVAVGYDGNAIIVNDDNPLQHIDTKTVHEIFTGKINNWKMIGGEDRPIVTIVKEKGRSTRKQFETYFGLAGENLKIDFTIGSDTEALVFVGADSAAIGFVSIGASDVALSLGTPIKKLLLDGVVPSQQNVANGTYKFGNRPLNLITKGKPSPEEQKLINFVIGTEGQKVVSSLGYSTVK